MPDTLTDSSRKSLLIFGTAMFIFALFPALSLLRVPSDVQPNAVLFAAVVFLLGRNVAVTTPIWLLVIMACGAGALMATGTDFAAVRSLVGYCTVLLVSAAVLILAKNDIRLQDRVMDGAVYVWLFVGMSQLLIARSAFSFLVMQSRTTAVRGAPSLANEPSAYATVMLFFLLIYFLRGRERTIPALLCLFQIVFVAQSALGVLFAVGIIGLYILVRQTVGKALLLIGVFLSSLVALAMVLGTFASQTRIGFLLSLMLESPGRVFLKDQSINSRALNIFYPFRGAFDDYLMPHGFSAWTEIATELDKQYAGLFMSGLHDERIMSGYGSLLFELGFLGLIVPILLTVGIFRWFGKKRRGHAIAFASIVHLLLLTPIPMANPLVGLLMGEVFAGPVAPRLGTRRDGDESEDISANANPMLSGERPV